MGFELDAELTAIAHPVEVRVTGAEIGIPGLYPFQARGIEWLQQKRGRGLLGDEMGLGKTVQAAGWLRLNPEARPCVIVVPASLKINWTRELEKWIGETGVVVLSGKRANAKTLAGAKIVIINYDILGAWLRVILDWKPVAMIADESHYIKNLKAARTKAVRALAQKCKHTIFLTGTPITNRPVEFFSVLNILDPAQFDNWHRYTEKFCGAYQDRWGWQVGGATNTLELHERVSGHLMLRRKKEDVLKDLPAKRRLVVPLEIDNRKEYIEADTDLQSWVEDSFVENDGASQAEALVRISVLKQMAAAGKLEAALEWIENALENNGKLVVFAVHHKMIDALKEHLSQYNPVVVDGRVSMEKRQEAVDRFQTDPTCKIFVGNIKAAGVGITLTAASTTVFLELGWTPGEHDQAEDRVHRIGQEAERVEAYYLVASTTIEEEIAELIDRKRVVLNEVLDGRDTESSSLLMELLRSRRRPAEGKKA